MATLRVRSGSPATPDHVASDVVGDDSETLRLHARAIASTSTIIAVVATLLVAAAVAYLMRPLVWPIADGTIEYAQWWTGNADDASGASVAYTYEVDGETYRSDRLSTFTFGGRANAGSGQWSWDDRALIERLAPGTAIDVRYDPRDPSYAVIVSHWNMPGLWAAGIILLVAWGIAFECWRRSRGPLTAADLDTLGWRWGNPD